MQLGDRAGIAEVSLMHSKCNVMKAANDLVKSLAAIDEASAGAPVARAGSRSLI